MNKSNLESFVINKHTHILFIANPYKKNKIKKPKQATKLMSWILQNPKRNETNLCSAASWNWLGKHFSTIWNLTPLCSMWCIQREWNTRTKLYLIGIRLGDSNLRSAASWSFLHEVVFFSIKFFLIYPKKKKKLGYCGHPNSLKLVQNVQSFVINKHIDT